MRDESSEPYQSPPHPCPIGTSSLGEEGTQGGRAEEEERFTQNFISFEPTGSYLLLLRGLSGADT